MKKEILGVIYGNNTNLKKYTMKKFITKVTVLLSLLTVVACSEDALIEDIPIFNNDGTIKEICITGKDFQFEGETRSSVSISESGASFLWDEDDVIGIFPNEGDQVSFAMSEGAGTQTATFSGGGWALKSSATYAAYYPHVYENRDMTKIPVSYVGQTQNGNNNTDHIGAYDFMAAGVSTPSNGAVAFDMQHLGCLVQLTIAVPEPSTLNKVVLTSSTEFTETGTIDLTAETSSIATKTQSNTLEITLNNVSTTTANENVTVYFMTAPVDLTDSKLAATIHFADKTTREVELTGKNLQAGKAYIFSADKSTNESVEPEGIIPNNQIWYTSSDGKIVEPYKVDGFGANIISNTYIDGKGIIEFDSDVTMIGEWAFDRRYNLTSITLPNSLLLIDSYAFQGCTNIDSVTIPESVIMINTWGFAHCTNLTNFIIPNNVSTIGDGAFYNCESLKSVTIGDKVTWIGEEAFCNCSSLTSVTIPNSVTTIGKLAFGFCNSLKEFKGKFASDDSRCLIVDATLISFAPAGLTEYAIPNGVTTIGDEAFYCCYNLASVTIPNSVTSIGVMAFASNGFNNSNLNTIVIPDNVTSIGACAFMLCDNLKSVTIGKSVTTIGDEAFSDCYNLSIVYCKAITPPAILDIDMNNKWNAFFANSNNRKIFVPRNSYDAYKYAKGWNDYASDIVAYDF